jgi:Beta-galactosidase/FG-GAP-like repeat
MGQGNMGTMVARREVRLLRLKRLFFFAFICALASITGNAFSQIPRGVFSLLPSNTGNASADPAVYQDPDVDGISVRQKWSDLEPEEGVFDFTYLDAVVSNAAAAGKIILLRIGTSGGDVAKGGNTPSWIFTAVTAEALPASQKFFTFDNGGTQCTIPVFWDPVYLAQKKTMIAALGAHFSNNPAVRVIGASFANAQSEDWDVPHGAADVSSWLAAGYGTGKMLYAGNQILDATLAAFPNQYVTLAVGGDGPLDPDESYVARNAVLAARASWPGRLIVQKDCLAAISPGPGTSAYWQLLSQSAPDIAGQMLWSCYGDATYRVNGGVAIDPSAALIKAVDVGAAYGMQYIEIYRVDTVNLATATHYAHIALTAGGGPNLILFAPGTRRTAIWYLNSNEHVGTVWGPVIPPGFAPVETGDFNGDGRSDLLLYNSATRQTAIWNISGEYYTGKFGPTLPPGWNVAAVADFNGDGKFDYLLVNSTTRQTAIWYLNAGVYFGGNYGPTLPPGWTIAGASDFDGDGKPDYLLYNSSARQTAIWYLNNNVVVSGAYGPTAPPGWSVAGLSDFDQNGHPDLLLYQAATGKTAIYYLNDSAFQSSAYGPTIPAGYTMVTPK